jgi:hypothetical protein
MVNAGLALLCAVFALFLLLALLRSEPEAPVLTSGNQALNRQQQSWSWFRQSATVPREQAADEEYDEINIQAELMGVIIAPGATTATIRVGREEKVFRIGDELQSGIEVSGIERTRVVVSQGGRTLQLSFPERDPNAGASVRPRQGDQLRETGQQGFELADMFSAVPVEVSGHNGGLKLNTLSQDMKDLMDIRDDDVVVQVGTYSIQDLLANPAQWVNFSTETALPVTVIRDGEELVLYVNALSLSARLLPRLPQD